MRHHSFNPSDVHDKNLTTPIFKVNKKEKILLAFPALGN